MIEHRFLIIDFRVDANFFASPFISSGVESGYASGIFMSADPTIFIFSGAHFANKLLSRFRPAVYFQSIVDTELFVNPNKPVVSNFGNDECLALRLLGVDVLKNSF